MVKLFTPSCYPNIILTVLSSFSKNLAIFAEKIRIEKQSELRRTTSTALLGQIGLVDESITHTKILIATWKKMDNNLAS